MPICIHCNFFNQIPQRLRTVTPDPVVPTLHIHKRYCRHIEREVDSGEVSCEHFTPYEYFWCDRFSYRLHVLCCLNRQKMKMDGCRTCSQGDDILDIARGKDLYELFGVQRKIHQNKIKKKPKLRRRKA